MSAALEATEMPLASRGFDDLLAEAVRFHGHECPGQVLGVRMTLAGCREIGIPRPRSAGKRLVVFVEIDRCATDAIQALTGVSVGKRTLKAGEMYYYPLQTGPARDLAANGFEPR